MYKVVSLITVGKTASMLERLRGSHDDDDDLLGKTNAEFYFCNFFFFWS